jgi:hypothetical protein
MGLKRHSFVFSLHDGAFPIPYLKPIFVTYLYLRISVVPLSVKISDLS